MSATSPTTNSPVTINFRQCPTTSPTASENPDPMASYLGTGCYEEPIDSNGIPIFSKLICAPSQNPEDRVIPAYSSSNQYVFGYYNTSMLLTDTTSPCYVAQATSNDLTGVYYNLSLIHISEPTRPY